MRILRRRPASRHAAPTPRQDATTDPRDLCAVLTCTARWTVETGPDKWRTCASHRPGASPLTPR